MWRYIRYILLKNLQNLNLKIEKIGKECYQLTIPEETISINFMIPKKLKRKDKNSEMITILIDTLKKQIKQEIFFKAKKKSKKKILTNKKEMKKIF